MYCDEADVSNESDLAAIPGDARAVLDPQGQVLAWDGNRGITGYGPTEILGQPVARLYTPEDSAIGKPESDLAAALRMGRFEETGFRVRKDGTRFRALVNLAPLQDGHGRLMGFVQVLRDLSRSIEAEEHLQAHEAQHRSLVDSLVTTVSDAVVTLTDGGSIRSVNTAFETLFGRDAQAVLGTNIKTLIASDFHGHIERDLRDAWAAGTARPVAGLHTDGSHFPIEIAFGQATVGGATTFVGVIRAVGDPARSRC